MQRPGLITIDGPAGSGKSWLAENLATQLGWQHLNSGLLYRAITLSLLENLPHLLNDDFIKYAFNEQELEMITEFRVVFLLHKMRVLYLGTDITPQLHNHEVSLQVPIVSRHPKIRELVRQEQDRLTKNFDLITEGRDCGKIFNNASTRIFLTATLQQRASRIAQDGNRNNLLQSLTDLEAQVDKRDKTDGLPELERFAKTNGYWIVDNTGLNQQETLKLVLDHIQRTS